MVGAQDVALGCHVNDLSKSAGHSGALRRNENLRLAPHLHLHGNDGTKETARLGGDLEKRAEVEMRRWLRTPRQRDRGKFT
jgi:hypothetical protein